MMKRILFTTGIIFLLLGFSTQLSAQTRGISYQAVARDGSGANSVLMANQTINVNFKIREGSAAGAVVYEETHSPTTNGYALFSVVIGEGTVVSGDFNTLDWAGNDHFLEVGINGASVGTTELNSVPYSKVATDMALDHIQGVNTAGAAPGSILKFDGTDWVTGNDEVNDADADPVNELQTLSLSGTTLSLSNGGGDINLPGGSVWNTTGSNIYYDNGFVGIGTSSPTTGLHLSSNSNNHDIRIDDTFPFVLFNTTTGNGNSGLKFEDQGGYTGWITHFAATDAIYISGRNSPTAFPNIAVASNGRVGIGTGTPNFPLDIAEDTMSINGLEISNLGSSNLGLDGDIIPYGGSSLLFDLGNNTSTQHWDQVVANSHVTYSDARLKNQIADLPIGLSEVMQLRPVQYKYNTDIDAGQRLRYGLIAQEVEAVIPGVVINDDVDVNPETGQVERIEAEYKAMNYVDLVPVLIKAVQEQQDYIQQLEQRIKNLENKN
jgi:hypothetical protein